MNPNTRLYALDNADANLSCGLAQGLQFVLLHFVPPAGLDFPFIISQICVLVNKKADFVGELLQKFPHTPSKFSHK